MVTMAIEEKRLRSQLAELDLMAEHVEQLTDTLRMINVARVRGTHQERLETLRIAQRFLRCNNPSKGTSQ